MKTLVLLLVLLSNLAIGQSLPVAVDNSKWFPPVRSQQVLPNCTQFSLIYYLKSSIWNKKFNRDPKLEVNQFNHNFVWNQTIDPVYEKSNAEMGFNFMKKQGCATMADFPANEQSVNNQPSTEVKIKALSFKSKRLFKTDFNVCGGQYNAINQKIISLKDSLSQGKCFTINILIFDSFFKMSVNHNIYSCYGAVSLDSIKPSHVVTVVGYDDNIKTAKGKGAFKVIDSNNDLTQGVFYLDYNWLYLTLSDYTCYFLEEDFSSTPKMVVDLKISNVLSGKNLSEYKYCFGDTTLNYSGKKVDFINFIDYLSGVNQIQTIKVNNKRLKLRSNSVIKPFNNLDGNYELISDLSSLSSVADFKSAAIVVFDPVSVDYIGVDGKSFYTYTRESKITIDKAYLEFIGTEKKIIAKVKDLSDTTIVTNNFYSIVAGLNLQPFNENIYVKTCTSVLKRKLITFSIADAQVNTAPVFTQVPSNGVLTVKKGELASFNFKATDAENNPLTYSMDNIYRASINSLSGAFSYQTSVAGDFTFTVKASDGVADAVTTFTVKVEGEQVNQAPNFITRAESGFVVIQGSVVTYTFHAIDPEGVPIVYAIVNAPGATLDSKTGDFTCRMPDQSTFSFKVSASDGVNVVVAEFSIAVIPNSLPVFTQVPGGDFTVAKGSVVRFTFKASDPEGCRITFSVNEESGATINPEGEFFFQANNPGTFDLKVSVSDGFNVVTSTFTIKVNYPSNSAPVFTKTPGTLKTYIGQTIYFQLTASDAENDQLKFVFLNSLDETSITNYGLLSFKATKAGTYKFTILVSDGQLTASTEVTVIVDFNVGTEDVPEVEYSVKTYPNPVVSNLNIEFVLNKSSLVNITLYDLQGRLVTLINKDKYEAGENTIDFDASNLRSGTYLCKFVAGNFNQTIKIIKQ